MPRSYGTFNSHSQIWRFWDVNWRTVQGSVFLGFLPVVHQKWNIRCSVLLHKELRAEIALIWKSWAQSLMTLLISLRFQVFAFSFPLSNTLSSWIQMFSNLGWIWLWGMTQHHLYGRCVQSTFYSQLHCTGTSSWADRQLGVTGKKKESRQPSWHEIIMTMRYPRQGKVSSRLLHKSHSCIFQALHQTPTFTY